MDEITFAVVGAGFMGGVLARVGRELPYSRCIAAVDVDIQKAEQLVNLVGGNAYSDLRAMFQDEHPDAIIVATPENGHRDPAVVAAENGSHVFVEKPMATTLEDADAIVQASESAGVKLMIGHILRFDVNYAMIQDALREGSLGQFLSAYARRMAPIDEARRLGGRVSPITYIAVHDIDLMLWYHPEPVKSVYARALRGRVWEELQTFDSAWLTIEFTDGALGIHEVGWCLPEEWAGWQRPESWGGFGDVCMNVLGTQGVANINFTPMDLYACDREGWKFPDTRHWPSMNGKLVGAAKLEIEHFFECIQGDQQPLVTGEIARRSVEVMLAAEMSIAENRVVSLPV